MLVGPRDAAACSCTQLSPCEAYAQAGVVFVGKATTVVVGPGGAEATTFAVTETLKGRVAKSFVVEGGGMCGASFVKGQTYVVYAGPGPRPSASLCGGTTLVTNAREALAYARGVGKRTKAVLAGRVHVAEVSGKRPVPGVEVRVRDRRFAARTDNTGAYRLELPPGTYKVGVVDPQARVQAADLEVELVDATACARRDFDVVWNGRVRGRVTGVDGKPAAGVQVTLVGTKTGNQLATTDAKGDYAFAGVPAGDYTVVVYATKTVAKTTYYPATVDATQARPIKLSQSGLVQKIDIKLQP